MLTKLNSAYAKFKNNITRAIGSDELQVNHVLFIAFAVILIALTVLVVLFVAVLTWPVATFSVIVLAALVRVLYAGCSGR